MSRLTGWCINLSMLIKLKHTTSSSEDIASAVQVIKCWRQHIGQKTETELLRQYGVPGLLMSGGVILGKLVCWGFPTDLHNQLEVKTTLTPY